MSRRHVVTGRPTQALTKMKKSLCVSQFTRHLLDRT